MTSVLERPLTGLGVAQKLFDFSQPEVRLRAFLLLLVAALLSPNIATPGDLPVLRLEQLLLAAFLPSLGLYLYRRRPERALHVVDLAFATLAAAVTLTLIAAPFVVDGVVHSVRDVFELARLAEYWLLFRLGLTILPDSRAWKSTAGVLLFGAVGLTIFSLLQYLRPGNFNDAITTLWATEHNLEGVIRRGRVIGTTGNANYYGIFSGFLAVFALSLVLFRERLGGWATWLAPLAASAAVLSLVMSQSRTATFAMLGAMFLGLMFVAWQRGRGPAYARAIGLFVAAAIVSVAFVEAVPPQFGSFHERFAPTALTEDSSVGIRVSKWRSVFAGFLESRPDFCAGETLETRPIVSGHEIAQHTGTSPAPPEARARDVQRKDDVIRLAAAVVDYFCANDQWPHDVPLEEALVPAHLDEMPVDPANGEPYLHYITGGGIVLGAELENPADPEGPVFTLGTIPNFVLNPSFQSGAGRPASWLTAGTGADEDAVARQTTDRLFGEQAADIDFPPGGALFQNIVYEFPAETPYTAGLWVRSPTGEDQEVQIYLTAQLTDGTVLDPVASTTITAPAEGSWIHGSVAFETPAEGRIHILRYLIRTDHDGEPASVQVDGATLTRGPFPVNFHRIQNVDPASLVAEDRPGFASSPLIGIGPRRAQQMGAVDNEYVLFLENFGILGTLAYAALWGAAMFTAWRAWRHGPSLAPILALSIMVFIVALAAFNITAGSFYHFQLMAVFWLLIGLLAAAGYRKAGERPPDA